MYLGLSTFASDEEIGHNGIEFPEPLPLLFSFRGKEEDWPASACLCLCNLSSSLAQMFLPNPTMILHWRPFSKGRGYLENNWCPNSFTLFAYKTLYHLIRSLG